MAVPASGHSRGQPILAKVPCLEGSAVAYGWASQAGATKIVIVHRSWGLATHFGYNDGSKHVWETPNHRQRQQQPPAPPLFSLRILGPWYAVCIGTIAMFSARRLGGLVME